MTYVKKTLSFPTAFFVILLLYHKKEPFVSPNSENSEQGFFSCNVFSKMKRNFVSLLIINKSPKRLKNLNFCLVVGFFFFIHTSPVIFYAITEQ